MEPRMGRRSFLRDPGPRRLAFQVVEMPDGRQRERLAHLCHERLPPTVADQRDPLHLIAMGGRKLHVVPQGVGVPPPKVLELASRRILPSRAMAASTRGTNTL